MISRIIRSTAMPLRAAAALVVLSVSVSSTLAADLPQSRLGALFVEPAPVQRAELPVPFVPWFGNSPRVAGYYGTWGDFHYSNYYGTSPFVIFTRPPYSCAWYGGHCW
jgi:hypothetical protein